jgi:basic membrane lipoprotein Med (substrate-binding protein (PBP1-ABC) superfamily)
MTKRVDIAVYEMIKAAAITKALPKIDVSQGGFKGGTYSGGLAEGWTGCSRLPDEETFWEQTFNFTETALPTNVLNKLIAAQNGIVAGTISVPSGYT